MNKTRLESFIFDKLASSRIPGVSIALVKGSRVVYARGFGASDVAHGLPAEPETIYAAASITKSFTAIAIMQLAQKGLLRLDDPVNKHVPCPLGSMGSPVRIEHLLSHTSGTCALGYIEAVQRHANDIGGKALPIAGQRDIVIFMQGADEWVYCPPGRKWFYLNEGYVLLDRIIEKVSGEPFEQYVREKILDPLGMSHSYFTEREVLADGKLSVPYVVVKGEEPRPGKYAYGAFGGDAAIFTSVLDLAKYLVMFLNCGRGAMSAASYRQMVRPRIAISGESAAPIIGIKGASARPVRYAFGLRVVQDFFGEPLVEHGGNLLVSTGYIGFLPASGLGVAVLANGKGYSMPLLGRIALAEMLGHGAEALPYVRHQQKLQEVSGVYETYRGTVKIKIVPDGDMLRMEYLNAKMLPPLTLVPDDLEGTPIRFFSYVEGLRLPAEFSLTPKGMELIFERYKFRRTGPLA